MTNVAHRDFTERKPLPAPNSDFYELYETLEPRRTRDGQAGPRVHGSQGRARHHEILGG